MRYWNSTQNLICIFELVKNIAVNSFFHDFIWYVSLFYGFHYLVLFLFALEIKKTKKLPFAALSIVYNVLIRRFRGRIRKLYLRVVWPYGLCTRHSQKIYTCVSKYFIVRSKKKEGRNMHDQQHVHECYHEQQTCPRVFSWSTTCPRVFSSVTSLSIPYKEIINMYTKTTVLYHVAKTFFFSCLLNFFCGIWCIELIVQCLHIIVNIYFMSAM